MPKRSQALEELPSAVLSQLQRLGENLGIARKRRRVSLREWAGRIGVSLQTLHRMEQGDPSVAFGLYASALWMVGRAQAIADLADPRHDLGALENEVRAAQQRSVRKPASVAARLAAQAPAPAGESAASPPPARKARATPRAKPSRKA
jgi:transcriptional regulator with XRE-family HTH domain